MQENNRGEDDESVSKEAGQMRARVRGQDAHLDTLLPALDDVLALLHQVLEHIRLVELNGAEEKKKNRSANGLAKQRDMRPADVPAREAHAGGCPWTPGRACT